MIFGILRPIDGNSNRSGNMLLIIPQEISYIVSEDFGVSEFQPRIIGTVSDNVYYGNRV